MSGALFLGSSHVAAFKLAHEIIDPENVLGCTFACARGADLAFTRVEAGVLRPSETAEFDAETIAYTFPGWMEAHYLQGGTPTEDVASQFLKTSGKSNIDISCISMIFYVLGVSPYDFMRLSETVMPLSSRLRRKVLGRMLADRHILRHQIEAIRRCNPSCTHHLIAMPLKAIERPEPSDIELEIIGSIVTSFASMRPGISSTMSTCPITRFWIEPCCRRVRSSHPADARPRNYSSRIPLRF